MKFVVIGTVLAAAAATVAIAVPGQAASERAVTVKNGNLLYNGFSYDDPSIAWEALFFHAPKAAEPSTIWSDYPDYYVMSPRYSPDGTQVANVFTEQSETNYDPWVRIRDVATGETTSLIPLTGYAPTDGLDWSPDGTQLVATTGLNMFVIDIATRDVTTILTRPTYLTQPAWSPDGTRIAYSTAGRVRLIRPDGSGRRVLSSPPIGDDLAPTWSPDSKQIAFITTRYGDDELVSLPRSGAGEPTRISQLDGQPVRSYFFVDLDWSPDGQKIAALELQSIDHLAWTRIRAYRVDGSGKYWLTPRLDPDGLTGSVDWGARVVQ